MKSKQVILELQSNRLDVVQYEGGRCTRSRRIATNLDTDPNTWIEGVGALAEKLRHVVEELGLTGQSAIVLYSSPTQVVDLVSTEVKSAADACESARLRCIDSLPFSSLMAVCDSRCIGRDNDRTNRKFHALAAADREDILTAITDLVEQAGLFFQFATPISVSIFRTISARAMKVMDACVGHLFLGERHSYFLISDRGRIVFSRLINIGIDAMARSLTRPIKGASSQDTIELDVESARTILYECGIPNEPVIVDETLGLTSRQLMPLLQPILQRLLVELRQSMRFGLSDAQRESIGLRLSGPGCSLNGIAVFLEDALDINVKSNVSYEGYDHRAPGAGGSEFLDAVHDLEKNPPIRLLPESHAMSCRMGKLRQWLWAGAAAAVLLIGLDGIGYQIRIDWLDRQLKTVEGLSQQFERLEENGTQLRSSLVALRKLEDCVTREMGTRADYRSALQELSRITPENLRFMKINFVIIENISRVSLSGYAFDSEDRTNDREVQAFMDNLKQSPLFVRERLISVQSGSHENRKGQRFEIVCMFIHTPPADRADLFAGLIGEVSR